MSDRHPGRRVRLITAAGITAVVVAGAFAIGANIGILDASSDDQIGALAAAGDLTPATDAAPVPTDAPPPPRAAQTYVVDVAGTITVEDNGHTVVVDTVEPNPGWTWAAGPSDDTHTELTFTDGNRTLVFTATRTPDGRLDATVGDATPTTAAPPATAPAHDANDDTEEHDDEEHEHEGWDDDD